MVKVMMMPPARVRKPLERWLGSWDCKESPTCTMPQPSRIRPMARIRLKMNSLRLFTTVSGSPPVAETGTARAQAVKTVSTVRA